MFKYPVQTLAEWGTLQLGSRNICTSLEEVEKFGEMYPLTMVYQAILQVLVFSFKQGPWTFFGFVQATDLSWVQTPIIYFSN